MNRPLTLVFLNFWPHLYDVDDLRPRFSRESSAKFASVLYLLQFLVVAKELRPSEMVLSPAGNKVTALGCLMASIECNMPVLYVETLRYRIRKDSLLPDRSDLDIIHVWLSGEVYANETSSG